MSLQVVTIRGRKPEELPEYYFYDAFIASLKRYGVEPIILGTGPNEYRGLASKAKLLKLAIESGQITADHIILTDCFDVVYTDSPYKVRDIFLDIQTLNGGIPGIIWGAEKRCFSDPSLAVHHPTEKSSYRYLNSGWGIGETNSFWTALKEMDPEKAPDDHQRPDGTWVHENDQNLWMLQMLFGSIPIGLDYQCQMVWCLGGVDRAEVDLSEGKFRNIETGTYPPVLHANGAKEAWRDTLLSTLKL